jgi:hypothetical protein
MAWGTTHQAAPARLSAEHPHHISTCEGFTVLRLLSTTQGSVCRGTSERKQNPSRALKRSSKESLLGQPR